MDTLRKTLIHSPHTAGDLPFSPWPECHKHYGAAIPIAALWSHPCLDPRAAEGRFCHLTSAVG